MKRFYDYDVVIVGTGASGLSLAISLGASLKVAILSKNAAYEGSTFYAQGGIAAVLDDKDTTDSHKQDTMDAGAGLCREEAVAFTVNHAKEAINWLVDQGVEFDKRSDKHPQDFHLTQEGGHSHRRILHAADATGKAVSSALLKQASSMPNITFFEKITKLAKKLILETMLLRIAN